MAKLLKLCKIIVWDECTMAHKKSFETLNTTLKDINNNTQLMGGKLILLAGDFRQILPVIPKSTPADEINACLKSSHLWKYVKQLALKTNMRIQGANAELSSFFSKTLLQIGEGTICSGTKTDEITFPSKFCHIHSSLDKLITTVYPNIQKNYKDHKWLMERVILAPKNEEVNQINDKLLQKIPGKIRKYKSIDTVIDETQSVHYPIEFINTLETGSLPPHILTLKIGAVVIMLRNINPPILCNGTRLIITKMSDNLIEGTILNGKFKNETVLIPRIPMITSDLSIEFRRLQFPIRLAFAMTINKAQGQSLKITGINLEKPCFSHGQLYVGCSRQENPEHLHIFCNENKTKNIVYPIVLQ